MNLGDRVTLLRLLVDYCEEYDQHPGSTPTTLDDIADDLERDIKHTAGVTSETIEVAQVRAAAIILHTRRARGNVSA